jgi:Ran GTPase-activating protein (RanGAP) involved in mRNA processing and transport
MNLEEFLVAMPADLGEFLIPAGRALLMHRVSKRTRSAIVKMQCRVDVQPGKMIRQKYADEDATLVERRAAVRLFVAKSLWLSMSDFRIVSFKLHGMVIDHVGSLNAMLQHARGLEVLDLYNNHINEELVGEVFAAIPSSLRLLRLARQWIHRAAVTPLCALLARLTKLEELDLSENYLNSFGIGALTASVSSKRLERVALGFNHLKSRFWNEHAELGLDRFVLKVLDLRHNMLQSVYFDSMYLCVRNSAARLQEMDLSYNDLRLAGISYLSMALQQCFALKHLNIAGNQCGDAAVALLLGAICPRENRGIALESLDIARNNLTCASARKFSHCMSYSATLHKSLCSLSFSNNDLNDTGAMHVIEALLPCAMRKLYLAQCKMAETAGLCLAECMLHWPMLDTLDVYGNRLCTTSLQLIARAMVENESYDKHMLFIGNWVLQDYEKQIEKLLAEANITHGFVNNHTLHSQCRL